MAEIVEEVEAEESSINGINTFYQEYVYLCLFAMAIIFFNTFLLAFYLHSLICLVLTSELTEMSRKKYWPTLLVATCGSCGSVVISVSPPIEMPVCLRYVSVQSHRKCCRGEL